MAEDEPRRRARIIADAARRLGASERNAFLNRECGADAALRALVDNLLDDTGPNHSNRSDAMAREIVTGGAWKLYRDAAERGGPSLPRMVGRRIGGYRVLEQIGAGGMGEVYRAERVDGSFDREVAIKVSTAGVLNDEFRSRFRREQGILASLSHPGITQLFDAGITEDGLPFIVMELVAGRSIDEYCRSRRLAPEQIIELLLQIADAVSFAHARLIVHRDIKPSNVLVTETGEVKLLDFGIAKLLGGTADAATDLRPLSPRYASPEQLLGQEITIASDLFQIGLLMVELLTGAPARPERGVADEILLAAEQRPLVLEGSARRALPEELRQVAEQCLRTDPVERYADVNALARDLRRYRQGYPVSAVGQTPGYLLRKFLQRNRRSIAAGTAAALFLAASVQVVNWVIDGPACQRPTARLTGVWDQPTRSAVVSALTAAGIAGAAQTAASLVDRMDRYVEDWLDMHEDACIANRVEGSQSDVLFDRRMLCLSDRWYEVQALSQALQTPNVANLHRSSELLATLEPLARCADLEAMASRAPPPPAEVADRVHQIKQQLANVTTAIAQDEMVTASAQLAALQPAAVDTGYTPLLAETSLLSARIAGMASDPSSEALFRQAINQAALARDDALLAKVWIEFAFHSAKYLGRVEQARGLLFNARAAVLRVGGASMLDVDLASTEALIAYMAGDLDQAVEYFGSARSIAQRLAPDRVPLIVKNLAAMHRERGDLERSSALTLAALPEIEKQYGAGSVQYFVATEELAKLAQASGDHEAAIGYLTPLIEAHERARGGPSVELAHRTLDLGWSLKELGRLTDAIDAMQTALWMLEDLGLDDASSTAFVHNSLGDLYMYLEDHLRSETHLNRALEMWSQDEGNPRKALPMTNLGLLKNRTGEHQAALDYCRSALAIDEATLGADHYELAYALTCIGEAMLGLQRPNDAVASLTRAVALRERFETYEHAWSRFLLGRALTQSGESVHGASQVEEARKLFATNPPPDPHIARIVGQ